MIQQLQPISNESDILREANAMQPAGSPPPQPSSPNIHPGTVPVATGPTPPVSNNGTDEIIPAHNGYDPTKIYGKEAIANLAAKSSVEAEDAKKIFTYRLPRFSYILIWFHGFAVFMLAFMFMANFNYINAMKADDNSSSLFSYSYYTSTNSGADEKPYNELLSVVFFGITSHEQNLKYVGIPLAISIFMLFVLLRGNRVLRYAAIGVCLLVIAYLIYLYVRFQIDMGAASSKYDYDTNTNSTYDGKSVALFMKSLSMTTFFWPYLFFPIATFIYLLTPTAREAYD